MLFLQTECWKIIRDMESAYVSAGSNGFDVAELATTGLH